jgi:hypothetical protein
MIVEGELRAQPEHNATTKVEPALGSKDSSD